MEGPEGALKQVHLKMRDQGVPMKASMKSVDKEHEEWCWEIDEQVVAWDLGNISKNAKHEHERMKHKIDVARAEKKEEKMMKEQKRKEILEKKFKELEGEESCRSRMNKALSPKDGAKTSKSMKQILLKQAAKKKIKKSKKAMKKSMKKILKKSMKKIKGKR